MLSSSTSRDNFKKHGSFCSHTSELLCDRWRKPYLAWFLIIPPLFSSTDKKLTGSVGNTIETFHRPPSPQSISKQSLWRCRATGRNPGRDALGQSLQTSVSWWLMLLLEHVSHLLCAFVVCLQRCLQTQEEADTRGNTQGQTQSKTGLAYGNHFQPAKCNGARKCCFITASPAPSSDWLTSSHSDVGLEAK